MTRISVVIPCHNYGTVLGEAVASVEAQTRPADEIVVVDDGSTDTTPEVIAGLVTTAELRVVARRPARGPARTFNDGVAASSGELVTILSADDRFSARYLELTEQAMADPGVDFAYTGEQLFGAEERWKAAPPFDPDDVMVENPYNGSALMRRSMFDKVGGFREDFDDIGLEDWEFWVHAISLGARGQLVEGAWLEYRRHDVGSRNTIRRSTALRAHRRVRELHPNAVRRRHLARWMARSVQRNLRRRV